MIDSWVVCALKEASPSSGSDWLLAGSEPVSEKEVADAQRAIQVLTDDFEQRELNMVLDKFKLFVECIEFLPSEWEAIRGTSLPLVRPHAELTTRLFDWLEAVRAFLNHSETRLNRRYGKGSEELSAFEDATHEQFDTYFAYRFFSKLRNYGHVDFPALRLSVSEGINHDTSFSVELDRDELLNNFSSWGPVEGDLIAQPNTFPFFEEMGELMACLDRIKTAIDLAERAHLADCLEVLDRIRSRLGSVEGYPHLLKIAVGDDELPRALQLIPLPPFRFGG